MTEENQKEQFSLAYTHAVATVAGYKFARDNSVDDDSIDATIAASGASGTMRSPKIDIQLKCSSQSIMRDDGVHFVLPIKNYNDLRHINTMVPRILVVVLVPAQIGNWLEHSEEMLVMKKCAYWLSLKGLPEVENEHSVTVTLPRANTLSPQGLVNIMQAAGSDVGI